MSAEEGRNETKFPTDEGDEVEMSEKEIESIVRDFHEAYVKRDVEKMLSFFAEDAVLVTPAGTFKGKHEVKRYWTWETGVSPTETSRASGIGIMVKENRAVSEAVSEGDFEGKKFEAPGIVVYEFSDGKIQRMRMYYDKLSIVKQVAMQYTGITGWFMKRLVNYIVGQAEKGLH
jgi:ketosteroid isomerase-like protein